MLAALLLAAPPEAGALETPFGTLAIDLGALGIEHQYQGAPDAGLGLGFVQLRYRSPAVSPQTPGPRLEALAFAVRPAWEQYPGDFDDRCAVEQALRELHLTLPVAGGEAQFGRADWAGTAMDGNAHQGVEWRGALWPGATLRLGMIGRWVKHQRIHLNFRGLTEWQAVSDVHPDAGDAFWHGALTLQLGKQGFVEPFWRYQAGVMQVTGVDWDLGRTASGGWFGFDGSLARYGNRWPARLQPDYEDVFSWLLHGYRRFDGTRVGDVRVGLGWYGVNNRRGDLGAGLFYWIDPLMVDETQPYDDGNNARLLYADAAILSRALNVTLRYGYGVNHAIEITSNEIDLVAYYQVNPSLRLGWLLSINTYSGDRLPDYTRIGSMLTYSF